LLQFLFQNLLSDKGPIKTSLQYPGQVRVIHIFDYSYGLFQVGEAFGRAQEKNRNVNNIFRKQSAAVFQGYGSSGLQTGCVCPEPADFLEEFIRNYRSCDHAE
jgi:hypothetical protein